MTKVLAALLGAALVLAACGATSTATPDQAAPSASLTTCENAVLAWATSETEGLDGLEEYRPMFEACTEAEFLAANDEFTTEDTHAPAGFVDRRCREYGDDAELGQSKLCLDAAP